MYHNGPKRDELIPMVNAKAGKLAFLTSRRFGEPEARRIVIASYEIDRVEFESWGSIAAFSKSGTWVTSSDFSKAPLYWEFQTQSTGPSWGTGLFRYLKDSAAQKLQAAVISRLLISADVFICLYWTP